MPNCSNSSLDQLQSKPTFLYSIIRSIGQLLVNGSGISIGIVAMNSHQFQIIFKLKLNVTSAQCAAFHTPREFQSFKTITLARIKNTYKPARTTTVVYGQWTASYHYFKLWEYQDGLYATGWQPSRHFTIEVFLLMDVWMALSPAWWMVLCTKTSPFLQAYFEQRVFCWRLTGAICKTNKHTHTHTPHNTSKCTAKSCVLASFKVEFSSNAAASTTAPSWDT